MASTAESKTTADAAALTVKEIKSELKARGVSFGDCFDRESLISRLNEANEAMLKEESRGEVEKEKPNKAENRNEDKTEAETASSSPPMKNDDAAMLEEIRSMRVKELRGELARRNIRWAGLLEKEDLVSAVYQARLAALNFSATGLITPGEVGELTGPQMEQELAKTDKPMLLDCYAVWCGPCQMMAPQLQEAAKELGDRVRVAKMDTDKHPNQASSLKVQGLPSLLLFQHGKEVDRIEGALMKDQLLQWIDSKL